MSVPSVRPLDRTAARVGVTAALVAVAGAATLAVTGATAAAAAPSATAPQVLPLLHPGQTLRPGDALADPATGQTLTMQTDGNLVHRYLPGARVLFATRTFSAGSSLTNQTDGNVVVRNKAGKAVWTSGVRSAGDLTLAPCGALTQTRAITSCVTGDARSQLFGARTSPDGLTTATLQTDGNLVVRTTAGGHGSRLVWLMSTSGSPMTGIVQSDGNFVLRRGNAAIWASLTAGRTCSTCALGAVVRDDGNLLLTSTPRGGAAATIWAAGSSSLTWSATRLPVTSHGLGPVQVGMTTAQARTAAAVPLDAPTTSSCPVWSTPAGTTPRAFVLGSNGRVAAVLIGNSGPITDVTDRGVNAWSTATQVLAAYGSAARSSTDIYGSFVILARNTDGNELRFDFFDGRGGALSMVQAGVPSVVERTELCG